MPRDAWIAQIENLRRHRTSRAFDVTLARPLAEAQKLTRRLTRALGGLGDAWEAILPPQLAASSNPERLAGGVLTIRTADAAARFALDRWLRAGGEDAVRRACAGTVRRIRLA